MKGPKLKTIEKGFNYLKMKNELVNYYILLPKMIS